MAELFIIQSCDGCGSCCFEQDMPPGYSVVLFNPDAWPRDTGDHDRLMKAPSAAVELIMEAAAQGARDQPCCWLDLETRKCRFYEHRPSICREMELGSESCRMWRAEYNIDVAAILASPEGE